ncbi:unnamed protein product [Adineta steineri]|uniref:Uncharacterized protein n=2 Tax=Adineta steineri TaxID=433720 RepID=A0A818VIM4_9BILA|nr:unnamed protein product [Adineta steineri]CAF3712836.1 unnamed protein product [Adineta steineri]
MQVIRQTLTTVIQRPASLVRASTIVQQVRFDGSDPRSSTSSENHKSGQQHGSNLNKSKGGDKKQKPSTTDDTKQPGATRKDWSKPDQVINNDPQYGKAGGSPDAHNPDKGKK